MRIDDETCFRACGRDARFDGLFFVGVTTTRIYCRPICPARTAGRTDAGSSPTPRWPSGRDFGLACDAGRAVARSCPGLRGEADGSGRRRPHRGRCV